MRSGETDWAHLDRDLLARIVDEAGGQPVKYASVCRGWRWILDDPQFRRDIFFTHSKRRCPTTLREASRSLARFLCSRSPATTHLTVVIQTSDPALAMGANAALGAAAAHVAPTLTHLYLDSATLADVLLSSPCTRE